MASDNIDPNSLRIEVPYEDWVALYVREKVLFKKSGATDEDHISWFRAWWDYAEYDEPFCVSCLKTGDDDPDCQMYRTRGLQDAPAVSNKDGERV